MPRGRPGVGCCALLGQFPVLPVGGLFNAAFLTSAAAAGASSLEVYDPLQSVFPTAREMASRRRLAGEHLSRGRAKTREPARHERAGSAHLDQHVVCNLQRSHAPCGVSIFDGRRCGRRFPEKGYPATPEGAAGAFASDASEPQR
jgi:hypothetical protein